MSAQLYSADRVRSLDGLRAIAVSLVVIGHIWSNTSALSINNYGALIITNSGFGVRLFFVLSGFLITTILLKKMEQSGSINLINFFSRRFFRIVPVFMVYILVMIGMALAGLLEYSNAELSFAGLFAWNYAVAAGVDLTPHGHWYFGHLWTLALEMQFYFLWPLLFLFFRRRGLGRICCVIILLMPIIRLVSYILIPEHRGSLGMMFHSAADTIIFGCGLAIYREEITRIFRSSIFEKIVFLFCWIFPFFAAPLLRAQYGGAYMLPIGYSLEAACAAGIVYSLLQKETLLSRALSFSPLVGLGVISYSVYVWQQLFTGGTRGVWDMSPVSAVGSTLLFATASYLVIEKPFMNFKLRAIKPVRADSSNTAP